MIKRILVALDRDPDTPVATRYAIELAEIIDASLTGLAVIDTEQIDSEVGAGGVGTIYYANQLRNQMTQESRKEANKLIDRFSEMVEKSEVKHVTRIDEGVPYERIIEDQKYHDLLVIGRESHFFYNRPEKETRTLAKLVKNGPAPTLMVTESYKPIKKVVIAHDGSRASSRTIQWFMQLSPYGKKIEIHLVHVCDVDDSTVAEESKLLLGLAADYIGAHGYDNLTEKLLPNDDSNGQVIINHVKEIDADLVVMGAHAVSAIRRLTFGSTTHELVKKSPVPLFLSH